MRNKHQDPKIFLDTLQRKYGIKIEFVRNKQDKIFGLRFKYEEQTFKGSEIGKEFGLRSLFNHFNLQIKGQSAKARHLSIKPKSEYQQPSHKDSIESALDSMTGTTPVHHGEDDVQEDDFSTGCSQKTRNDNSIVRKIRNGKEEEDCKHR